MCDSDSNSPSFARARFRAVENGPRSVRRDLAATGWAGSYGVLWGRGVTPLANKGRGSALTSSRARAAEITEAEKVIKIKTEVDGYNSGCALRSRVSPRLVRAIILCGELGEEGGEGSLERGGGCVARMGAGGVTPMPGSQAGPTTSKLAPTPPPTWRSRISSRSLRGVSNRPS